ncbi:heavy metal response regulator transcription factor [Peristeroidobacter soli]|jgi:two-component system copper resistance phosphate regulon response regulator CusR|uniref:heavy metal response regulator transcription factor n=1 Tax=Peristeroidobacter soli TaxID=2497877 RepID=UPI00101C144E|nr:heavy metal response regulator transcription factor [Peristeroidobacter soli]
MRLLLVEDEEKTRTYLCKGLKEAGFVVDSADDGVGGAHLMETQEYDLLILDVMLPGRDGWSLVSQLRASGKRTPVLFLTARDQTEDLVKGLELGADDYVVKPFVYAELLARVRALTRRAQSREPDTLRVADLELDFHKHRATRAGRLLDLTPKEFLLLALLMRRQGEVLSRTLIASQVWDINFDSDLNLVDVSVGRLRRKVDGDSQLKLIHTVRGVGFVLEAR